MICSEKNDGFNGTHAQANGATVTLGVTVNYAFDICGQDDICSACHNLQGGPYAPVLQNRNYQFIHLFIFD